MIHIGPGGAAALFQLVVCTEAVPLQSAMPLPTQIEPNWSTIGGVVLAWLMVKFPLHDEGRRPDLDVLDEAQTAAGIQEPTPVCHDS